MSTRELRGGGEVYVRTLCQHQSLGYQALQMMYSLKGGTGFEPVSKEK